MALVLAISVTLLPLVLAGSDAWLGGQLQQPHLLVKEFAKYPGYAGPLAVVGTVGIHSTGEGTHVAQLMSWRLEGTDAACKKTVGHGDSVSLYGVENACGVHIHVGADCADAETIGGHLWNTKSLPHDPWQVSVLDTRTVRRRGVIEMRSAGLRKVTTGLSSSQVSGHVMLVHDISGKRVACGKIRPHHEPGLSVVSFARYPGYTGPLAVTGAMSIYFNGKGEHEAQLIVWMLEGADPACRQRPKSGGSVSLYGVENACGVHIHVGTDCADAETIGGHLWSAESLPSDPWQVSVFRTHTLRFRGANKTRSVGRSKVTTGLSNSQVSGHVMVVHDVGGGRVACGRVVLRSP